MTALLTSISPETGIGILIAMFVIVLSGLTVVHIEAVRAAERRR